MKSPAARTGRVHIRAAGDFIDAAMLSTLLVP